MTPNLPIIVASSTNVALTTFSIYLVAVMFLAWLSSRGTKSDSFVDEYFLGGKRLGVWAFALTFAATSASGGSFVGFPALIYTHGWILALWIGGYMLVPLVAMGLLGKRLNKLGRETNAVTIPEVLGNRFESPVIGILASLLIVVFMFIFLLAQFKAGSTILSSLLGGVSLFETAVEWTASATSSIPYLATAEPDYLLCLFVFSIAVIGYVVYGGFQAVVWTDVMQGVVMFFGVVFLLVLTLRQAGGLTNATKDLAKRTPPVFATGSLDVSADFGEEALEKGSWIRTNDDSRPVARIAKRISIGEPIEQETEKPRVLLLTNDVEIQQVMEEQSIVEGVVFQIAEEEPYAYGHDQPGVYLTAPGPHASKPLGFLGLGTALSFFAFWTFSGAGQPSNMVRLMAFKDTKTLQRSIVTVTFYFSFIYFSLVLIFCCSRILLPGMEVTPDRAMPDLAVKTTENAGMPWLAGLLLAAPFAAVMSSVDSFLLLVSSSIVRDVYQRLIDRDASESRIKTVTYMGTLLIGVFATLGAIHPPEYLQDLIVFASGGLSATFLVPVAFALYWRRMNSAGAIAGMLGGFLMHFWITKSELGQSIVIQTGLEPFIWDVIASILCVVLFSLVTPPLKKEIVDRFF